MILMTKCDIYTMFRNLYAKHGIVMADKAFQLDIYADQLPEDLALNVRKSALIFNLLCGAPELWTGDGETDVFLMCGWDTYYLTTLMPHKVAYFHKLKTERQQIATAAGIHYNDVMLMPIAYYLNLANSVAYQNIYRSQFTEHVGSAVQQTAEDLYARILVALQNTANTAARMKVEHGRSFALGSLVQTCANLKIELEKPNHARSTGDLIHEVGSDGLNALYCFWSCIRAPYMPFEDLCFLIGIKRDTVKVNIFDKLGALGATIGAIYETVKLDGAPLRTELPAVRDINCTSISELVDAVGSSSDIYGAILDAVGDKSLNRTQVKNVLHVFVRWINDSFVGRNDYAAQTQDDNIIRGAAPELKVKFNEDGYAEINVTVDSTPLAVNSGFASALKELREARPHGHAAFAETLKRLFGEKVRLSPIPLDSVTEASTLVHYNDSNTRKYMVLWASTGAVVCANIRHNRTISLIDGANVAHLYKCYVKLHSQPSETMPCSHFTSRPT